MKIALTTDHAGFEQLKNLQFVLEEQGHDCVNFGPREFQGSDDYPDYIFPAAKAIAGGECEMGIIMGGSGQGEAMAANRIKGVRCAVYYGPARAQEALDAEGHTAKDDYEILRLTRQHNNANVLSIGERFLSQPDIEQVVTLWLNTPFSGIERHERRIKKLDDTSE